MAFVTSYYAELSLGDSRKKDTPARIRVSKADYDAYNGAANFAAALLTPIGLYFAALSLLTASTVQAYKVYQETINDTGSYPAPDDNVYNFDKINVAFRAGLDNYNITIPGRDDTAYTVSTDGVTIITTDPGWTAAVEDYVTQFNAVALGKNGTAGVVQQMYVGS
jgi:hypothetical protein